MDKENKFDFDNFNHLDSNSDLDSNQFNVLNGSKWNISNHFDNISLIKCVSFFIAIYLILKLFSLSFDFYFDSVLFKICLYIPMLLFFIYKLGFSFNSLKSDFDSLVNINFKNILFIVIANAFFSALIFFILSYFSNLGFFAFDMYLFGILDLSNPFYLIAYFLAVVVLSPIIEEMLFRGVILRKLTDYRFDLKWAIIISSLLFGLCHSFGGILSAFVFGICMAIIYIKSNNILVPIFGHFLNNLISFILACLGIEFSITSNYIIVLIIVIISIIIDFILFKEIFKEFSHF